MSWPIVASKSQTNFELPAMVAERVRPSGENVSDRTFAKLTASRQA